MDEMNCRFVVSVDTEEDVWGWASRAPITCRNAHELPRLARFFQRLHVRPTFFVSYQVLADPSARAIMKELGDEEGFEIGCHVHPWNTPPFDGSPRRTALYNLPRGVQGSKIATVTELFEEVFGRRPSSFRAGRFGFGPATSSCLIEQGYRVDSSVTPLFDWQASSDGQNYVDAPMKIYRIKPEHGVLSHDPRGRLIEVPLTSGYTRLNPASWAAAARFFDRRAIQMTHVGGVGAVLLGFRKTILSPESHTVGDMVALGRRVLQSGVGHLHLFFHSSSLLPGLTPFTRTQGEVERLYDRLEEVIDRLHILSELQFVSVRRAAELSFPGREGPADGESGALAVAPSDSTRVEGTIRRRRREPIRWAGPYGLRARLGYAARYAYWRLGGYRRFGRVRWSAVRRLVFVCTGNICRSPFAEYLARGQSLEATSLGVETQPDAAADPTALRIAREWGVPMDDHRTMPLALFEPREGDLFVAMEPSQAAVIVKQGWSVPHQVTLLGLWAGSGGVVIPDPYGGDERRFHHCFSVIDRGVRRVERRLEVEASTELQIREVPSSHAAS